MIDQGKSALLMAVYNHTPPETTLRAAMAEVDFVYFINNGSDAAVAKRLEELAAVSESRVFVIQPAVNLGVSRAYNLAVDEASKLSVEWIFFLDHDASCDATFFEETRHAWLDHSAQGVRVGLVAPIVADDGKLMNRSLGLRRRISLINSAVTSGILTTVEVFQSVGGFDERLFVEGADYELTSRIRRLGWALCRVNKVLIVQDFASPILSRNGAARIGEGLNKIRSFVRVSIGNANFYRKRLSLHNPRRWAELLNNWESLRRTGAHRGSLSIPYYLNKLEYLYIQKFCLKNLGNVSSPDVSV